MSLAIAGIGAVQPAYAQLAPPPYASNVESTASAASTTVGAESGAPAVVYEPGPSDAAEQHTYSSRTAPQAVPAQQAGSFGGDEAVVEATGGTSLPPPELPETPRSGRGEASPERRLGARRADQYRSRSGRYRRQRIDSARRSGRSLGASDLCCRSGRTDCRRAGLRRRTTSPDGKRTNPTVAFYTSGRRRGHALAESRHLPRVLRRLIQLDAAHSRFRFRSHSNGTGKPARWDVRGETIQ